MHLRSLSLGVLLAGTTSCLAMAQDDNRLIDRLLAFHGTETIVSVMSTHCYETTGLDGAYLEAADNWYLRNVSYLDLADRVIERLGGAAPEQVEEAETYSGTQIMSAYNAAADKSAFCSEFIEDVTSQDLDIDNRMPDLLEEARAVTRQ
ncbi:hypothetical protein GCM10007989_20120 [Devosia pacifica]|uniref:Uncharacterized protein n=1 Tax=Devosia pacifica TaxID=1335967 RepID=A0A918S543_9HYPH|nr:hypothetical protein [Devosia pacifica]GHA24427.1 hypothetical protein GCM10007989_20120 [Devosia pacifica]